MITDEATRLAYDKKKLGVRLEERERIRIEKLVTSYNEEDKVAK